MADSNYGEFIAKIFKNLEKNGFPDRQVAFPVDSLWEAADKLGLNFRKVLEFLREKEVDHRMDGDKIIFHKPEIEEVPAAKKFMDSMSDANNPMAEMFRQQAAGMGDVGEGNLFEKATEMLKNMSPEQMSYLQNMMSGMSDEDKKNLIEQAKKMGFPS